MQHKKVLVLDEKDIRIADVLINLGVSKNIAKSILYLSQTKNECNSIEIESGSGLRQPEVSIAMQELLEKDWITKRVVKKKGKGRPVHLYKIKVLLIDVISAIEKEKMEEIENIKKELEEVKNLISS